MLLTLTTTHAPATDLGFLLHKHPDRHQAFDLPFGTAHVFYPEASADRCTAALFVDVDPVALVRGRPGAVGGGLLGQYVNDRPYVASSFLSVAMRRRFSVRRWQGRCKDSRPELARDCRLPLRSPPRCRCPCGGGADRRCRTMFEPLGYEIEAVRHPLDGRFPVVGREPVLSP